VHEEADLEPMSRGTVVHNHIANQLTHTHYMSRIVQLLGVLLVTVAACSLASALSSAEEAEFAEFESSLLGGSPTPQRESSVFAENVETQAGLDPFVNPTGQITLQLAQYELHHPTQSHCV
jgi:hypothetical protein